MVRFGKIVLQDLAHFAHPGKARGGQAEQVALGGAAPQADQPGALQPVPSNHHARADIEAAGHAVGFGRHHAGDLEILPAQTERVAGLYFQTHQQIVGDHHGMRH